LDGSTCSTHVLITSSRGMRLDSPQYGLHFAQVFSGLLQALRMLFSKLANRLGCIISTIFTVTFTVDSMIYTVSNPVDAIIVIEKPQQYYTLLRNSCHNGSYIFSIKKRFFPVLNFNKTICCTDGRQSLCSRHRVCNFSSR
jgi:hypothetical protein